MRCLVSYGGEQLDECLASLAERADTVKGCLVDSRTQVLTCHILNILLNRSIKISMV